MSDGQDRVPSDDQDPLIAEASLWFARMRGPDAETLRPDFTAWLARGASHLGAFNRAAEVWNIGKLMAEPELAADVEQMLRPPRRLPQLWPRVALIAALIITVLAGVSLALRAPANHNPKLLSDLAAAKLGGNDVPILLTSSDDKSQRFALTDGSTVDLAKASRLAVGFTPQERSIRLIKGSSRFTVAHEQRPFVVYAGGGSVTARGTVFDVAIDTQRHVTVRLLRGVVDVRLPARGERAVKRLAPGDAVQFRSAPALDKNAVDAADTGFAVAEDPVVEFDEIRLADVLARANAGATGPILVAEPAVADLKVSGRLRLDDPPKLAEKLAALFDLGVEERGDGTVILGRRKKI